MEARDVPALFAVHLGSIIAGDTAATITGSLSVDASLPTNSNGDTLVEASSIQEAVGLAVTGTITVEYAGQTWTYSMGVDAVGASPAEQKPFLVTADGSIQFEDMAGAANSDWDYNDCFWAARVKVARTTIDPPGPPAPPVPPGPPSPPSPPTTPTVSISAITHPTEGAVGSFLIHRSSSTGGLTVTYGTPTGTATEGADYTGSYFNNRTVNFLDGQSDAVLSFSTIDDTLVEPTETIVVGLTNAPGYTIVGGAATVLIYDNDSPTSPPTSPPPVSAPVIDFDLDVNANGLLTDTDDRAANYLPGYKGTTAMVSTGTSFNAPGYQGQRMKLVINGVGKLNNVTKVEFSMSSSYLPGYASNRSDPNIEPTDPDFPLVNTHDYAFQRNGNNLEITIDRASLESQAFGGPFGGAMEDSKTWVNFYCKDYGGYSSISAKVWGMDGGQEVVLTTLRLKLPVDTDNDTIADKWEIAMGTRWSAQYGEAPLTTQQALAKFNLTDDNEKADPDGAGALVAQAETGDAHTVLEEYRGYVLDGGGLDGANGHAGGHIRLDPARKEILVEVDRAAVLNKVPGGGLPAILNGTSGIFCEATRGAGVYMYWLMDDTALNLPKQDLDTVPKQRLKMAATRNPKLKSDFLHVLIFDEGNMGAIGAGAGAYSRTTAELNARGVVIATVETDSGYTIVDHPKREETFSCVIAHEITHLLIPDGTMTAGFNEGEHIVAPLGGTTDVMYIPRSRANRELATVKISSLEPVSQPHKAHGFQQLTGL